MRMVRLFKVQNKWVEKTVYVKCSYLKVKATDFVFISKENKDLKENALYEMQTLGYNMIWNLLFK